MENRSRFKLMESCLLACEVVGGAWSVTLLEPFSSRLDGGIVFAMRAKWLGEAAGFCWWSALLSKLTLKQV
jgi:hypothetical protein